MTAPGDTQNDDTGTDDAGSTSNDRANGNGASGGNGNNGNGPAKLDTILEQLDEDGRKAVRSELERARGDAAKYRTKANRFGDIDPERAKAAIERLDEIEAASKSDADRAAERATAAENDRDTARKELWRERVGRKHGLSDTFVALVQGDTEDDMDAHARSIADELGEVRKRPGDAVPGTPKPERTPGADDSEQFDAKKIAAEALRGL